MNSKSKHVIDYCSEASSLETCTQEGPTYRNLHCVWNPDYSGVSFGEAAKDWHHYKDGSIITSANQ